MATPSAREEYVYMAKLAEQAERYEEMVKFIENVVSVVPATNEFTVEERNLLSVAYKNVFGAHSASWWIVSSIEQKEEGRGNADHVSIIREYKTTIEAELFEIFSGILKLLEEKLVLAVGNGDSKVFYLKMKRNYHRWGSGREVELGVWKMVKKGKEEDKLARRERRLWWLMLSSLGVQGLLMWHAL